jgi:hypothetical protein
MWVYNESFTFGPMLKFKQYLISTGVMNSWVEHRKYMNDNHFINVSDFAKFTSPHVEKIKEIASQLQINSINTIGKCINNGIDCGFFGIYIDYLVRYKLSILTNQPFFDNRAESMIKLNKTEYEGNYEKAKQKIATNKDIFNISKYHSIFFGESRIDQYIDSVVDVDLYLQQKVDKKSKILLNPGIGHLKYLLKGDADLIIDDELIDMKCSNHIPNLTDWVQLLVYYCLCNLHGHKINKLTIWNPIKNTEYQIDVSKFDISKIEEILISRVSQSSLYKLFNK